MAGPGRLVAGGLLLAFTMVAPPAFPPPDPTATEAPSAPRLVTSVLPGAPRQIAGQSARRPYVVHPRNGDIPLPPLVLDSPAPAPATPPARAEAVRTRDEARARPAHTLVPGAPLWAVTRRGGLRLDRLAAVNHFSPRATLHPGQASIVSALAAGASAGVRRPATPAADAAAARIGSVPPGEAAMFPPSGGRITSRFGWRIHPIFRTPEFHTGLDIANRYGAPVRVALSGIVRFAGWMAGYGRLVVVDHEGGLETSYSHLSMMLVSFGERVIKGQLLGRIGNTGWSTGPHLFFEVRRNGVPLDPIPLLWRSGALAASRVR
jgi:murein DD-endopeptidase MepM/ murein hydrolase activator NlpD